MSMARCIAPITILSQILSSKSSKPYKYVAYLFNLKNFYNNWILAIAFAIAIPFLTSKWRSLLKFKDEVDTAVETIEEIAQVVEKVAEVVEKVAVNVADDLPEGRKLREVVDLVEDIAEKIANDAHLVENAIDKFQEIEEKLETQYEANVHSQKVDK